MTHPEWPLPDKDRAVAFLTAWHLRDNASIEAILDETLTDSHAAGALIMALVTQNYATVKTLAAATGSTIDSWLQTLGAVPPPTDDDRD